MQEYTFGEISDCGKEKTLEDLSVRFVRKSRARFFE